MREVWVNTASNIAYVLLNIVVAVIIFSAGWIAADFIGKIVGKIIGKLKLDIFFKSIGLERLLDRGNIKLNTAVFVEGLVKWFIVALFFMASLQVLGLDAVAQFIQTKLFGYLPIVINAVFILLVSRFYLFPRQLYSSYKHHLPNGWFQTELNYCQAKLPPFYFQLFYPKYQLFAR